MLNDKMGFCSLFYLLSIGISIEKLYLSYEDKEKSFGELKDK